MHNCYLQWGGGGAELCGGGGARGSGEGGGGCFTRSPCRATAAAGRGGGSSCARCKATAGSSRSSPPPTGTGCGASAAAGKAPSRSWGRWCSPWRRRRRWTWAAPVVPACSRCRTRRCCRGWWEGRSDGRCRADSWNRTKRPERLIWQLIHNSSFSLATNSSLDQLIDQSTDRGSSKCEETAGF